MRLFVRHCVSDDRWRVQSYQPEIHHPEALEPGDTRELPEQFHALLEIVGTDLTSPTPRVELKQVGTDLVWPMTMVEFIRVCRKQGTAAPGLLDGLWKIRRKSNYLSLIPVFVEELT